MTIGVLITDGGPHPVEKWADATAKMIVDIADHVTGERRSAAIKLQAAIYDVLVEHHETVQTGERGAIKKHGHDRLAHPLDPEHHLSLDEAVTEIIAATRGTEWEAMAESPEFAIHLRTLLVSHFQTNMHIERAWHADRNPNVAQCKAFREAFHSGPGPADQPEEA